MKLFLVVLVVVAAVRLLFCMLTFLSKRRNRLTPAQVADAIEKHLEGTDGPYDWDDFTSIPIADDRLDAIRRRCGDFGGAPSSRKDLEELRRIISELRTWKDTVGADLEH
jgi:hypothetical protein